MQNITEPQHFELLHVTYNQPNGYQLEDINDFLMNPVPVPDRGYGIRLDNNYYNFGRFVQTEQLHGDNLYVFSRRRVGGMFLSGLVDGGHGYEFYSYVIPRPPPRPIRSPSRSPPRPSRSPPRPSSRNRRRRGISSPPRSRRAAANGGRRHHRTRRHKKN